MSNWRVASWALSCTEATRRRTGYACCAMRNVTSSKYRISPAQVLESMPLPYSALERYRAIVKPLRCTLFCQED